MMMTVRIHDLTEGVLSLDLRDLLHLLGPHALESTWVVSPVKLSYSTPDHIDFIEDTFEATGQGAGQLEEYARNRSVVSGTVLSDLAKTTVQVIWGEFTAFLPTQEKLWVAIRAIDSSFFEVSTEDTMVIDRIKATYKNVRVAKGQFGSRPATDLPENDQ